MVHLKCNNLNAVDAEVMRNSGSNRFWICMCCFNILLLFAPVYDHKLYQTLNNNINNFNTISTTQQKDILLRYFQH